MDAPAVLNGIMNSTEANDRHRIDACKTLNDFASNGPGASAPAGDRFLIQINLGSDVLTFNKSIKPDPNDIDLGNNIDTSMIAAIASKKPTESGSGEPV
jgi:hypothetical protein